MNLLLREPIDNDYPKKLSYVLDTEWGAANCCAFNDSGLYLALGCCDGTVNIFDFQTRTVAKRLHCHRRTVSSVSWSSDGVMLMSSDYSGLLALWNVATSRLLMRVQFDAPIVHSWLNAKNPQFALVSLENEEPIMVEMGANTECVTASGFKPTVASKHSAALKVEGTESDASFSESSPKPEAVTIHTAIDGSALSVSSHDAGDDSSSVNTDLFRIVHWRFLKLRDFVELPTDKIKSETVHSRDVDASTDKKQCVGRSRKRTAKSKSAETEEEEIGEEMDTWKHSGPKTRSQRRREAEAAKETSESSANTKAAIKRKSSGSPKRRTKAKSESASKRSSMASRKTSRGKAASKGGVRAKAKFKAKNGAKGGRKSAAKRAAANKKQEAIVCGVFDATAKYIVCGTSKGRIIAIERSSWKCILERASAGGGSRKGGKSAVRSIAFSQCGKYLLLNCANRTLHSAEIAFNEQSIAALIGSGIDTKMEAVRVTVRNSFADGIERKHWGAFCFSHNGEYMCASSVDKTQCTLSIWRRSDGHLEHVIHGRDLNSLGVTDSGVADVCWHPTDNTLVLVLNSGVTAVFNEQRKDNWCAFEEGFQSIASNQTFSRRLSDAKALGFHSDQLPPDTSVLQTQQRWEAWLQARDSRRDREQRQNIVDVFDSALKTEVDSSTAKMHGSSELKDLSQVLLKSATARCLAGIVPAVAMDVALRMDTLMSQSSSEPCSVVSTLSAISSPLLTSRNCAPVIHSSATANSHVEKHSEESPKKTELLRTAEASQCKESESGSVSQTPRMLSPLSAVKKKKSIDLTVRVSARQRFEAVSAGMDPSVAHIATSALKRRVAAAAAARRGPASTSPRTVAFPTMSSCNGSMSPTMAVAMASGSAMHARMTQSQRGGSVPLTLVPVVMAAANGASNAGSLSVSIPTPIHTAAGGRPMTAPLPLAGTGSVVGARNYWQPHATAPPPPSLMSGAMLRGYGHGFYAPNTALWYAGARGIGQANVPRMTTVPMSTAYSLQMPTATMPLTTTTTTALTVSGAKRSQSEMQSTSTDSSSAPAKKKTRRGTSVGKRKAAKSRKNEAHQK